MSKEELNKEIEEVISLANKLLESHYYYAPPVVEEKTKELESRTKRLLNKIKRFVNSRKKSS